MESFRDLAEHVCCQLLKNFVGQALDPDKKHDLASLVRELKVLGHKAHDVMKILQKAEEPPTKKRKAEVDSWLGEVEKVKSEVQKLKDGLDKEGYIRNFFSRNRAKPLNETVKRLIEQSQQFGELVLNDYGTRGEPLLTTEMFGEEFVKNSTMVCNYFIVEKKVSLGIYGMGGVGKTTLAKHIHNMLLEKTEACVCWVTFSGPVCMKKLQDEIAKALRVDLMSENDENKRAATLYRAVSQGKDTVFIFDDVWKDINVEMLGIRLCAENCRLVITSRSREVCNRIGCEKKVEVKTLNENDAWKLFEATLGHYEKRVRETAKLVAKECNGLPLGIVTMARTMREVTDIHDWSNALAELKESRIPQLGDMEQVFGVLQCSFNRLDPNYPCRGKSDRYTKLQLCFLYCSMYPEDLEIPRDELITKFISEELMENTESRKAQFDQGHALLNKLVNLCLLESVGGKYEVKMHGLMRDMALTIVRQNPKIIVSAGLSLMNIPDEKVWTRDLEKVSLMKNEIVKIPFKTSPVCPKLSTLILSRNPLESMPDSFFNQMQCLSILDLTSTRITTLPASLSNLVVLRMLLLRYCEHLIYVPDLTKIKTLRELDLSRTKIPKVPKGIEKSVNLKCLRLGGIDNLQKLSSCWLLNFPSLQQLILPLYIEAPIEEIEKLGQLEQFGGRLKNCSHFNRFIKFRRSHVYYHIYVGEFTTDRTSFSPISENIDCKLVFLNIRQNDGVSTMLRLENLEGIVEVDERDDPSFLANLPQSNSLKFKKTCKISNREKIEHIADSCCSFVSTFMEICLTGLDNLTGILDYKTGADISPQLQQGAFSLLEILSIKNCNKVKKLGLPVINLKSLKSISIEECEGIEEILEVNDDMVDGCWPNCETGADSSMQLHQGAFSLLEILCIKNCNKIKKLGLPVINLKSLKTISVDGCEELEEILEANDLMIGGASVSLPSLTELTLVKLPKLKTICMAKIDCNAIEKIALVNCRKLNTLPFILQSQDGKLPLLPKLRAINISEEDRDWWDSLEWGSHIHKDALQELVQYD